MIKYYFRAVFHRDGFIFQEVMGRRRGQGSPRGGRRRNMKKNILYFLLFFFAVSIFFGTGGVPAQETRRILSIEAHDMLNTVPETYLIDVRTRAEYQFVGHPIAAYHFPFMFMTDQLMKEGDLHSYRFDLKNRAFIEEIRKAFKKADNLLVLCRDGTRSTAAAVELSQAGFKNVYNVEDGFEGPPFPSFKDSDKDKFYRQLAKRNKIHGFDHRRMYGWQWWGLPWTYELNPRYLYPPDLARSRK